MNIDDEYAELAKEGRFWNEEYERCFGHPHDPPIGAGVSMRIVHTLQSKVVRFYIGQMKQILEKHHET